MKLLVTGGAGFIGSAVVRKAVRAGHSVVNLDKLTYAGNLSNVAEVAQSPRYAFERADICDRKAVDRILATRRTRSLRHEDLVRMGALMKKARPFVTLPGWSPGALTDSADLRARFAPPPEQLTLL